MPARQRMIHRLYLQRNGASANAYGKKSPQSWSALSTTPGYVWVRNEDTQHGQEGTVVSARYGGMVPLGTDVTEQDRVEKVEDRADSATELFGVMAIDAVVRRTNHLELRMRGAV